MKKNEVLKLVKIIFYGLAIVSLALSILGKVYAESMNVSAETYIRNYLSTFNNYGADSNVLNYIFENYEDYVEIVPNDSSNIHYFYFFTNKTYSFRPKVNGSSSNNAPFQFLLPTYASYDNNGSYSLEQITYTEFPFAYNDSTKRTSSAVISTFPSENKFMITQNKFSGVRVSTSVSFNCYDVILSSYNTGSITNYGNFGLYQNVFDSHQSVLISSWNAGVGNGNYYATLLSGTDSYVFDYSYNLYKLTPITLYNGPVFSSDSRLKVGSIVQNGRNELYIDMSEFLEDSLASSYNVSDLVLTVDFDGNVVTFDDLDSYIDIYSTDSGYDCIAFIPYTVFGFSDDNIISDVSVELTQVSFTVNALYPNRPTVSEDYYISTSYYLKNDLDNNVDWDNTNVSEQNNDVIQYDSNSFDDLKNSLITVDNQTHGTIYNDWQFSNSLPVWEDWVTVFNVDVFSFTYNNINHWVHVSSDYINNTHVGSYYYIPLNIADWIYDNAISQYYDVLVFENFTGLYEDVDITNPDGYLIFYSDRYFIKKNTLEIGNVHKTLTSVGNQVYTLYDITYKRLTDINGNIQKGFESVLSKDSAIISLLGTVNFNLDRFGNMINNNLGKLVTGVNGLYGSNDRDLTDIYNKLGTLVSNVDLSNTLNTLFVPTYTGFDDTYNSAIESMGILALPFEVSKDFINASKVEYEPTFKLTFPSFTHDGLTYWNEYNFELDPLTFLSSDWLEFLQYCNALFVIFSVTLLTYKHIFASPVSEESGVL